MNLALREVTQEDMDLLFTWANDPVTRQNAFHTESIPYETHKVWFAKMLADKDTLCYILYGKNNVARQEENQEQHALGQIRLAVEGNIALISYSIDALWRGKGFGTQMLLLAEEKLIEKRTDVTYCIGQVKYENIASARAFEKCGYGIEKKEQYLEFTKRIRE